MYKQLTVFDIIPQFKINYELRKQRMMIRDYDIEFLSFWYYITPYKCCGCYPKFTLTFKNFQSYCSLRCENCGRSTPVIDDYSWINTRKNWDSMMKGLLNKY